MLRATRKNHIQYTITFLIIFGNTLGAILTYLYFTEIIEIHRAQQNLSPYYADLFFGIGTGIIIFSFVWILRRVFTPLYQIANDEVSIDRVESGTAQRMKRKAIQLPSFIAGTSFLAWILAGFIFGFLQPGITQILYGVVPDLIECLKQFFGITCIGGSITALFIYFTIEKHWRRVIPKFFPEGDLSQVKDTFKLSVNDRLLIVFIAISSVPLPLLGIAAYHKAQALHKADAIMRTQLLSSLLAEIIVITAICVAASIVLSIFVSKSVSIPLDTIEHAMKEVQKGNLDVRVGIVSNDELGSVAEGFNMMIAGLKESESIKDSFGKYVSQEIRDEILDGKWVNLKDVSSFITYSSIESMNETFEKIMKID